MKKNPFKAQAGYIKEHFVEGYTLLLITVGLPLVAYVYFGWKMALTVCVFSQIALGILALRISK